MSQIRVATFEFAYQMGTATDSIIVGTEPF